MPRTRKIIAGVEFEALRRTAPRPHWVIKSLASGETYEPGVLPAETLERIWSALNESLQLVGERRFRESFALTAEQSAALLSQTRAAERAKQQRLPTIPEAGFYHRAWNNDTTSGFRVRRVPAQPGCKEHFVAEEWQDGRLVDFTTGSLAKCDVWVDMGIAHHQEWNERLPTSKPHQATDSPSPSL